MFYRLNLKLYAETHGYHSQTLQQFVILTKLFSIYYFGFQIKFNYVTLYRIESEPQTQATYDFVMQLKNTVSLTNFPVNTNVNFNLN